VTLPRWEPGILKRIGARPGLVSQYPGSADSGSRLTARFECGTYVLAEVRWLRLPSGMAAWHASP